MMGKVANLANFPNFPNVAKMANMGAAGRDDIVAVLPGARVSVQSQRPKARHSLAIVMPSAAGAAERVV